MPDATNFRSSPRSISACWDSAGHHSDNITDGVGGPQDPTVLYSERDVIADLGAIDCSAIVERARAGGPSGGRSRP